MSTPADSKQSPTLGFPYPNITSATSGVHKPAEPSFSVFQAGAPDPVDETPADRSPNHIAMNGRKSGSSHLKFRHVLRLYNAVWASHRLGYSMNVTGTIAWYLEFKNDQCAASAALNRFRKNSFQWLADKDYDHSAFIWVNENPTNTRFHTHFLMHIPIRLADAFRQWTIAHFTKALGYRQPRQGFMKVTVRRTRDARSEWEWLRYMAKGYDPEERLFEVGGRAVGIGDVIKRASEDPGWMGGKGVQRYGISRALHREQYQKVLQLHGLPDVKSPLERQVLAREINVPELYRDFAQTSLTPVGLPSYTKRKRERAQEVLEALSLSELDRALHLPMF